MDRVPNNIRRLSDYWHGLAGGAVPERSLFHIEEVASLLPYLLICEFESSPFRVRYRLSGTKVDQMTGMNLAGRYLDEFLSGAYGDSVRELHDRYETASRTGQPSTLAYPWAGDNPDLKSIHVGIFPLKVDGKISQCVAIEDYGPFNALADGELLLDDLEQQGDWQRLHRG
jgi:hypothetical protein